MPDSSAVIDAFISHAGVDASTAGALHRALIAADIRPWCAAVDLVPGDVWDRVVPAALARARLLIVLVSPSWPTPAEDAKSWYGPEEVAIAVDLARDRDPPLTVVPVYLDGVAAMRVPYGLRRLTPIRAAASDVQAVVTGVSRALGRGGSPRASAAEARPSSVMTAPAGFTDSADPNPGADPMAVDLAIITILPEEYRAALAILDDVAPYTPPPREVNHYGWRLGTLPCGTARARVVVAMLHDAGQTSGFAGTQATIQRFAPRYVIVLGVAGAMPGRGPVLGDVVVSSVIWGYEYGKIDNGFQPRTDRTYQVDGPLLRSATAHDAASGDWIQGVSTARPSDGVPRLHSGPVGSGDKVIDNAADPFVVKLVRQWPKLIAVEMEGAGAAAAARWAAEDGRVTGLLMVRGISDEVPEAPASDAGGAESSGGTDVRDAWKRYASASAAGFLADWVARGWPVAVSGGGTAVGARPSPPGPAEKSPASHTADDMSDPVELRRRLAKLYPTPAEARMVFEEAGFHPGRVDFGGGMDQVWYSIHAEVRKHDDGLARLKARVARDGYSL